MNKHFPKLTAAILMMMAAALCFFVACNKEDVDPNTPSIGVDQTIVDAPTGGGDITLTVTANRPWKLSDNIVGEKWLLADKTEGAGDAVITLTVAPNAGVRREADLRIATSTVYADVRITQPGAIATEELYADNFGTGASNASGSWPSVAEWTAWNISGLGAAGVTYAMDGGLVSVRSNSTSSYEGASGSNNVMMAAGGASFLINGIDPLGMTAMQLAFGANETNAVLKLYYNTGDATWTEVPFDKAAAEWSLVNVSFTLPDGSTVLNLKFTAGATTYGTRVDDLKLIGGGTPVLGDLRVSPAALSFAATGEAKTFAITSTSTWTVTPDAAAPWCTVSPASGSNDGTVTVTAAANTGAARTATLTVTSGTETKTVSVSQAAPGAGANAIYYEDMGKTNVTGNTDITAHTGWSKEGSGGGGVTYEGNAQVRTSVASTGYDGASGGNDVFFGTVISPLRHFIAKGIALAGVSNVEVSFGASKVVNSGSGNVYDPFAAGDLTLSYSSDGGTSWNPAAWTMAMPPTAGSTPTWGVAKAVIATAGVTSLSLKWECTVASAVRIDDIKVITSSTAPPSNSLAVSPAALDFAAAGEAQPFAVTSNVAWTVSSSDATWCTVSPASGSNDGTVTVTAAANSGSARAATITVSGAGVSSQLVAISQAGVSSGGGGTFSKVEWDFATSASATLSSMAATTGQGTLTVTNTSGTFAHATASGGCVYTSGWDTDVAWKMEIPVSGYTGGTIKVSYSVYGSNTGPRDFTIEWSADGTTWSTGGPTYAVTATAAGSANAISETISPTGLSDKLYIRLRVTSNTSINNGTIGATGTSRLIPKLTIEEQ